jgi:hypothetical protein
MIYDYGERGKKAAGQEFGKGKVDREGKLGGEEKYIWFSVVIFTKGILVTHSIVPFTPAISIRRAK